MTIPTGLGLTRGLESANLPGTFIANRATAASANDAKYGRLSTQPDACYCGCCDLEKSPL